MFFCVEREGLSHAFSQYLAHVKPLLREQRIKFTPFAPAMAVLVSVLRRLFLSRFRARACGFFPWRTAKDRGALFCAAFLRPAVF